VCDKAAAKLSCNPLKIQRNVTPSDRRRRAWLKRDEANSPAHGPTRQENMQLENRWFYCETLPASCARKR